MIAAVDVGDLSGNYCVWGVEFTDWFPKRLALCGRFSLKYDKGTRANLAFDYTDTTAM